MNDKSLFQHFELKPEAKETRDMPEHPLPAKKVTSYPISQKPNQRRRKSHLLDKGLITEDIANNSTLQLLDEEDKNRVGV